MFKICYGEERKVKIIQSNGFHIYDHEKGIIALLSYGTPVAFYRDVHFLEEDGIVILKEANDNTDEKCPNRSED